MQSQETHQATPPVELPNQLINSPQVQEATSFADNAIGFTPDVAYDDEPVITPPVTIPQKTPPQVKPIDGGEVVTAVPGVLVPERVKPPKPNKYRVSGEGPVVAPKPETSDSDGQDKTPGRLRKALGAGALAAGIFAGSLIQAPELPQEHDKTAVSVGEKPVLPTKKAKSALPGGIKLENPRIPTSDGNFGEPNPGPNEK